MELAVCGRLATAWGAVGCAAAIGCAEAEPSNGSGCALRAATAGRALLPGQRNGPAGRSPFAGIARIRSWGSPFSFSAAWLLSFPARLPGPPGSSSGPAPSLASQTFLCCTASSRVPRAGSPGYGGRTSVVCLRCRSGMDRKVRIASAVVHGGHRSGCLWHWGLHRWGRRAPEARQVLTARSAPGAPRSRGLTGGGWVTGPGARLRRRLAPLRLCPAGRRAACARPGPRTPARARS